ncbi:MAG: integrase [Candidatus Melainabacteria bacterium]|nr:MAG: integrase [Candidatus Melainabacteria bacterium]
MKTIDRKLSPKGPNTAKTVRHLTLLAPSDGITYRTSQRLNTAKLKNAPPSKPRNRDRREREYLLPEEVQQLRDAAKKVGRYGNRDSALILIAYRHALRVSELTDMKWEQVDFTSAKLHVNRVKNGDASVHFLEGDELRILRQLRRDNPNSPFIFSTERGGPISTRHVRTLVARAGEVAGITFPVHPHMLRHAKGYQLANKGYDTRSIQAYFGHRNIQHTTLYTQLSAERFRGFGKDV